MLNFGIPTIMYGLAGLLMANHVEEVTIGDKKIVIYFWYQENRNSPN